MGNETQLVDPTGNRTTFVYDAVDQLSQETDPLGHSSSFSYDPPGLLTSTTDRDGRVRAYQYDALNRMTTAIWHNADSSLADTLTYSFDANGNLTGASNNAGTYTIT